MGSVEVSNFMVNGDLSHENISGPKDTTVSRLHDIVHRLEEENDFLLPLRQNDKMSTNEHSTSNGVVPFNKEEEENTDMCALENIPPLDDREFDEVDYEKDDSWLYSPSKDASQTLGTPVKNPETWLKENAITPELLRVRSSLSEKLEVIAIENRKGRYDRLQMSKQDFRKGSQLSLDWDFEDDELANIGAGGSFEPNFDEFGSIRENSFDWEADLGTVQPRSVQAWAENSMPQQDEIKTFALDWSDDEEDELSPMHINLNQSQCQPRKSPGNNLTFKRGTQGPSVAAVRPRTANSDQSEFTAKLSGGVKPRRSPAQRDTTDMQYDDERTNSSSSSPSSYDYEDSAPVLPRGRKKDVHPVSPGYDEPVSAPVILRGTAKRGGHSAGAVSPRGQGNIVKPVRRKPLESSEPDNQVRPRGSAASNPNQVRPRGPANKHSPSSSNSEMQDPSLKVSLSSSSDGAGVVRRRGPVQTAEVAPMPRRSVEPTPRHSSADPSPRRHKDPLVSVRQQDVAPARRSTGSPAQPRSNDNVARPRRSFSPTARPRGSSPTGVARPRGTSPTGLARPRGSSPTGVVRPRGAPPM